MLALRQQGDGLRERNLQLETDLVASKKQAQERFEDNRGVNDQASNLRAQLAKLSKFRNHLGEACRGEAFTGFEGPSVGNFASADYSRARSDLGLRADVE